MKVLVLGADGQLGTDLRRTNPGHALALHTRPDADVTDPAALARVITAARPEWVINTVAYNLTDKAETDPDAAFAVNAAAAGAAARIAAGAGARLVHLSTDFVFDGRKGAPYVESDAPNPLGVYGASKREGERQVLAASDRHLVVRTAGLFGRAGSRAKGGNFVEAILARARSGQPLSVVADLTMTPTSTRDLAEKIWDLIARPAPGGLYHVVNAGPCTWHAFAVEILALAGLQVPVAPVSAAARPGAMPRGPNTALISERLIPLGLRPLRPWPEALKAYLSEPPRPV